MTIYFCVGTSTVNILIFFPNYSSISNATRSSEINIFAQIFPLLVNPLPLRQTVIIILSKSGNSGSTPGYNIQYIILKATDWPISKLFRLYEGGCGFEE